MKFQILELITDNDFYRLSHPTYNSENVYTLLTGSNASGKSRVLSKITNYYAFRRENSYRDKVITLDDSLEPSRIIAVSNSRFDRFPNPDALHFSKSLHVDADYHYLGLAGNRSSPSSIISRSCASIIDGLGDEQWAAMNLAKIFDHIGFLPAFSMELRTASGRTFESLYSDLMSAEHPSLFDLNSNHNMHEDLSVALKYILSETRWGNGKSLKFDMDLVRGPWGDFETMGFSKYVSTLLASGLLKVTRLNLYNKFNKDRVVLHEASSGQQCMLLMFFGIAGLIKDGSLICIDEPEISLHPKWQHEFIGILQDVFSTYSGCHFLIATHSPQVVAGLSSNNGFVADLEEQNILRSGEYSRRSADFQLSEIFHEPGFKNEYLTRILLVILSKLTKHEQLNYDEKQKLIQIGKVKLKMDSNDPVLHLYHQVMMLAD